MKSKDTLEWFPSQLHEVRVILGDAVVEVAKKGIPINSGALLSHLEKSMKAKVWQDNKEWLLTAMQILKDNQNSDGYI